MAIVLDGTNMDLAAWPAVANRPSRRPHRRLLASLQGQMPKTS